MSRNEMFWVCDFCGRDIEVREDKFQVCPCGDMEPRLRRRVLDFSTLGTLFAACVPLAVLVLLDRGLDVWMHADGTVYMKVFTVDKDKRNNKLWDVDEIMPEKPEGEPFKGLKSWI